VSGHTISATESSQDACGSHRMLTFEVALDDLDVHPDLVNQVLEVVSEDADDAVIRVRRYDLPPAS